MYRKKVLTYVLAAALTASSLPRISLTALAAETAMDVREETPSEAVLAEETPRGEEVSQDGWEEAWLSGGAGLEIVSVEGGEGVYQEGAFGVLGGSAYRDVLQAQVFAAERDLSGAEEYLYRQLLDRRTSVDVSAYNITRAEVRDFVFGVLNDHPDLYFVQSAFSYSLSGDRVLTVTLQYIDGCDDEAFRIMLEDALSVIDEGMTDLEKAIALHDYLVLNCEYDYENLLNDTVPTQSYSAYGVLVNRMAVCQGYALAYKLLCNRVGVECYMVSSASMNHAWNLIQLDGSYYQVDATWDDPVWDKLGQVGHNYMFVSDEEFTTGRGHSDWVVTKGSKEVALKAEDSRYDDAFWADCSSPLLLDGGMCYYIDDDSKAILKRNLTDQTESVLLGNIGVWRSSSGGYWRGAFSGLFRIGDRIYYNTPDQICSISAEGGEPRDETQTLSSGGMYVYGSALCRGKVLYVLHDTPNFNERETVLTAELTAAVPVSRIELSPAEVTMGVGEELTLQLRIFPSYADRQGVVWATDDAGVATVSEGVVSAVGAGSCTVTASLGGRSAVCAVRVETATEKKKLSPPVFSPAAGTIDQGAGVTLTAEEGAVIYYTSNGEAPVVSDTLNTKKYTEPIIIDRDMTIKAIAAAVSPVYEDSEAAEAQYTACTNRLILSDTALALAKGESRALEVEELPTTRAKEDVNWESSDSDVAAVDQSGRVTAMGAGEAVITAAVADHLNRPVTASCRIVVDASLPFFQVTFVGWNGRTMKTETVQQGGSATPPEVTPPAGYAFTGWKGAFENVQGDSVVEAQYEPIVYTIAYVLDGGSNPPSNPGIYTIETPTVELQPAYGREGYRFVGWYTDEAFAGNSISVIEQGSMGNLTLYACWRDERGLWLKAEGADRDNEIPDQPYTGKAVKPAVTIYYGDSPLQAGADYTVSYQNNNAVNSSGAQAKAPAVVIKGKGNYAGNLKMNFRITPKSLEDTDVEADALAALYQNGKAVKPLPTVKWNGKKLTNKKDFTVEYPDSAKQAYQEPGVYTVLVKGCGNYTGTRRIALTIIDPAEAALMGKVTVSRLPDQPYTGKAVVFTGDMPKLTYNKEPLVYGKDYAITLAEGDDGISVGVHEAVITGKGSYHGVRRISFRIKGDAISTARIDPLQTRTYSGGALTLDSHAKEGAANKLTVRDKEGNALREGVDYTVEYSNNLNAGAAKVKITGMGRYTGTVTKSFKILPYSLGEGSPGIKAEFVNQSAEQPYEQGGARPRVRVTSGGRELVEGTDYTLAYANNTSAAPKAGKTPVVTIKGRKNFTGSRTLAFSIVEKDLSAVTVTAPDMEENAKAGKYRSTPVLTDENGKRLKAGVDYEKAYLYRDENGTELTGEERPAAGSTLTVVVIGKGNYKGEAHASFRIIPKGKNLARASVKLNTKLYYTGENITLSKADLTVTLKGIPVQDDDYEIISYSYSNNLKKGTARVTIRGKGEYGGTRQVSFAILPQIMEWWKKDGK